MKKFTFKGVFALILMVVFSATKLSAQTASITPKNSFIFVGASQNFTVATTGLGASGDDKTFAFTITGPAATVPAAPSINCTTGCTSQSQLIQFNTAGVYKVKVVVTQTQNGSASAKDSTNITVLSSAPPYPGAPTASPANCVDGGTVLGTNPCVGNVFSAVFVNGTFVVGSAANGTSQGAAWRFPNVNGVDANHEINQVNAQITVEYIYQAVLTEFDDDGAQNEAGVNNAETQGWFAPRIDVDQSLGNTSRRGFVQFRIDFFQEDSTNVGADYTQFKDLLGINYSHRDIDGTRAAGYNFRETGVMKNPTGASLFKNAPTELTDYSYNDGDLWQGVAGSVCNRTNTSRYAEVAASFIYTPGTPRHTLSFRMGYDYEKLAPSGTYGDQTARLYASLFNCFDFPTPQETALPVKLSFFNAKREGNDIKLAWQTATESKNYGFEIERRIANGEWQNIGLSLAKSANGNSASPINYEYIDANNTAKGVIQYRLKQMDFDRHFAYSDIRAVRGTGLSAGLLIYPNPSNDGKVNIVFEDKNSAVDVSLSDMNGRTIKQWKKVTSSALQINNLTPGMYMLRIVNNQSGEQTVEKIMVNNR